MRRAPDLGDDVISRLRKPHEQPAGSLGIFAARAGFAHRGTRRRRAISIHHPADNTADLAHWGPILLANMAKLPDLQDVNTDQQNGGLQEMLNYDRVTAARLGQTRSSLNSSLSATRFANPRSRLSTPNSTSITW